MGNSSIHTAKSLQTAPSLAFAAGRVQRHNGLDSPFLQGSLGAGRVGRARAAPTHDI